MYEELYELLFELGLGAAAGPLSDLIIELTGEAMTLSLLEQEIRNVLQAHGGGPPADEIIAQLIAHGFADFHRRHSDDDSVDGQGEDKGPAARGSSIRDSKLLGTTIHTIVVDPRAVRTLHDTARGWLDIDGGIYFDVRQHAAGADSES